MSDVDYAALTREHPERERWRWKRGDYRLAYRGGYEFLIAAGMIVSGRDGSPSTDPLAAISVAQAAPRRRFLRQLEGEPSEVYAAIWDRAFYINYLGGILDYFRHYLFSQPPIIQPADKADTPDWWKGFYEDATGSGKGLVEFMRDVFLDVQIDRYAGWLFGTNTSVAAPDADDDDDDDRIVLTAYKAEEIIDWQRDSCGELEWIVLQKKDTRRDFPGPRMDYQEITYLDRQTWTTWQVVVDPKGINHGIEVIGEGEHGLDQVPFEMLDIPHGLWITDKLYSWQLDLFNKMVRLSNAQLMGCIVQPYIKSNDPSAQSRIFGEGVLLKLKAGDKVGGGEEDMGWKSPDVGPLQFIADQIDKLRDEGYRIVHNMAMAIDATVSRLAQSGISKQEDRKAAEVILCGLGSYVRPAMTRTANLLSKIYGDDVKWILDGYDNFQVSSLEEELQTASLVSAFGFWSKTAEAELHKQIETGRTVGRLDESIKETIRQEIDDRRQQEEESLLAPQVIPPDAPEGVAPPEMTAEKPGTPASPAKAAPAAPPGPTIKK